MKVLKNLFGLNKKINASDVAVLENNKAIALDIFLGNKFDYSLEEKVVGIWIDGKPLYQKTYIIMATSEETSYDLKLSNVDIIFINGNSFLRSSVKSSKPINVYESSSYNLRTEITSDLKLKMFIHNSTYYGGTFYITLNYTKK